MNTKIESAIKNNDILVFLVPNTKYSECLEKIVSNISKKFERICYVSLNKPYTTICRELENKKIDTEKFFFIDAVSQKIESDKEHVLYVSSPRALTELSITINKVLEIGSVQVVVFDSLSTLLVYEGSMTVIKFVHSIISTIRNMKAKAVFTCLKEDISNDLIKDLNMFADDLIELE